MTEEETVDQRKKPRRRRLLAFLLALLLVPLIFGSCVIDQIGGAFAGRPEDIPGALSPFARELLDKAFEGVEAGELVDYHTHVVGLGADGTGIELNERLQTWWHPVEHMKFLVYYSGAGIEDHEHPDRDYIRRLNSLIEKTPKHGRHVALAFDHHYDKKGAVVKEKSEFYVPNEYTYKIASEHPKNLIAAMSVHPYRDDALQEAEKWAKKGVKIVKWLPNAMGIDPLDARCKPFYELMKKYGLILLCHVGEEQAVEAEEDQELGNPLRLRLPLDMGVRVIAAHCASLGDNEDLDHPGKRETSFELFSRLMKEDKYKGLLFGELSAMTQFNRMGRPLREMLKRREFHDRLVNGSDYPLPAVNIIIRTSKLANEGFITQKERYALNEIYNCNPLLFDYVVKRTMRHPDTGDQFPASVFKENKGLKVSESGAKKVEKAPK